MVFKCFIILISLSLCTILCMSKPTISMEDFEEKARIDAFKMTSSQENPYAVLVVASGEYSSSICSGTLITNRWVLTAAHCLYKDGTKIYNAFIYAGGNSLTDIVNGKYPAGAQLRKSIRLVPHPRYKALSSENYFDVALIKVNKTFIPSKSVNTISITGQLWPRKKYTHCKVTGFGKLQINEENKEDNTRKTQTLLIGKPCKCEDFLKYLLMIENDKMFLCSKPVEDYGLCSGDSGGGLICNGKLQGVASSIIKGSNLDRCEFFIMNDQHTCGSRNTISLFVDVCHVAGWVHSVVKTLDSSALSPTCRGLAPAMLRHVLSLLLLLLVVSCTLPQFVYL